MISKMKETIEKHQMVNAGDAIVIGFSGGADSLALVSALSFLYPGRIAAVHVNHLFRGEAADGDESFAKSFCTQLGIPCLSYRVDVSHFAKCHGLSFEEAGRKVRYEKFEEAREALGFNRIATAHNQNDVVETLLINLLRGAGTDGMASIDYVRDHKYIRPFLDISRDAIEEYCQENQLVPRVDHTNAENDYVRNRIRNELLPYLKMHFNPNLQDVLFRTTALMKDERLFWKGHTEKCFALAQFDVENGFALKGDVVGELTAAEMRHLIRYSIEKQIGTLKNVSSHVVERVMQLSQTGKCIELGGNHRIIWQDGDLYFIKLDPLQCCVLPLVDVAWDLIENRDNYVTGPYQVMLDADTLKGSLIVRTRLEGDQFVPFGMNGHKKMKSFFIDEKVPAYTRDKIFLICDKEKIVWVYGYRMSNLCRITDTTKNIAIIRLRDIVQTY